MHYERQILHTATHDAPPCRRKAEWEEGKKGRRQEGKKARGDTRR